MGPVTKGKIVYLDSSSDEEENVDRITASMSGLSVSRRSMASLSTPKKEEVKTLVWEEDLVRRDFLIQHEKVNGEKVPLVRIPSSLYEKLYDFQRDGVLWMADLHHTNIGGLLGDDMGMGKTFQTLALIGGLMKAGTIKNALIVAPKSVLAAWKNEAIKVAKECVPVVSIFLVDGHMSKSKRFQTTRSAMRCMRHRPCIVIASYGLVSMSPDTFTDNCSRWDYVVLDEAQTIKNPTTRISDNCRFICEPHETRRLVLTGTPIMNNLDELWAIFDFVGSGHILSSRAEFVSKFSRVIEGAQDKDASHDACAAGDDAIKKLHEILRPYFLQRMKIDHLADKLPEKREVVVWVHLSARQRELYEEYVVSGDSAVASVLRGDTKSPLEAISWLKKLCGHPILVETEGEYNPAMIHARSIADLLSQSSKLQVLNNLVTNLHSGGHRTLIFSQSTRLLDIIERVLGERFGVERIDGKVEGKLRQRIVDGFNSGTSSASILLLSTKAGGVGLTLTGADSAIIFDPAWNPAEDAQAVDRCYRIGQTKPVRVFRFISAGTVESKVYEKQIFKDSLRRSVLTMSLGSATTKYFTRAEHRKLFQLALPGECETFSRMKTVVPENDAQNIALTRHEGVVGVTSHDKLYRKDTLRTLRENYDAAHPFGQAPLSDRKNRNTKANIDLPFMGKSQRVLFGSKIKDRVEATGASQGRKDGRKSGASRDSMESLGSKDDSLKSENVSPMNLFKKGESLWKAQKPVEALDIFMDCLSTGGLPENIEHEVHRNIAIISQKLGWLEP